jgi:hypothetical protein
VNGKKALKKVGVMSNILDKLSDAILDFAKEGAAPAPAPVGNASQTLDELSEALLSYLTAVEEGGQASDVEPAPTPRAPKDDDTYSGIGFTFDVGTTDGGKRMATALMINIDGLFKRVRRYTAQKARFITVGSGSQQSAVATTNVDLYAFSEDEHDLYLQFLREGSNRLWELLVGYVKDLPFKGYLFDEGVEISEWSAVGGWPADSFVKVDGKIYKALQAVPAGKEITDTEYWKEVSALYDTLGKVVFFVDVTDPVKANSLLRALHNVEDFLYAFVLWRWYALSGIAAEAQVWNATIDAAYSGVKSGLLTMRKEPVLRRAYPF